MMSGETTEFKHYVQVILNRLWLVMIVVVIAVAAAYWQAGRSPTRYAASATMLVTAPVIAPTPPVPGGVDPAYASRATGGMDDIIQLIASRPIAARVAKRLGLSGPATVQRAVDAAQVRGTSLLRISAAAPSPDLAANLANVTAEEFVIYFRDTNRASVTETRRFVEDQLAQVRAKLEASERALQAFRESRQVPSIAAASGQTLTAVASNRAAIDAATVTRREVEARLGAVRSRLSREQPAIVASRATTDNPVFRQLQTRLVDLEMQRVQLSQVYTPQHPRFDQITREIAEIRSRLKTEARTAIGEEVTSPNPIHARLVGDIVTQEVELEAVNARVQGLQAMQGRLLALMASLPSAEIQESRLVREQRVLESNYITLSTRYQEILLRENQAGFFPASLQLIEAAIPPVRSMPSAFPRTAAAAGLVGLALGIFAAFILETLDGRIRTAQEAEYILGVPVLAQVPEQSQVRTAPATAIFTVGIVLAVTVAAAVARGYVAPGAAAGGIRSVTATVASWINGGSR